MTEELFDRDEVGPVLRANELGRAVLAAIREANAGVRIIDRGAYYRVLARDNCQLTRGAVERFSGKRFVLPSDLEAVMPAFRGRLHIAADGAQWRV